MNKKRYVVSAAVFLVLAVLVYLQFRTWKNFDWARLLQYQLSWRHILYGVAYIYIAYFLRAVRWKIFLRPVRKDASILGLISPTVIGFAGLALLGRAGEMIRPYLISRRQNLPFASQIAVWAVERIFDVGGFTVLMVAAIFLPSKLRDFTVTAPPEIRHWIHLTGYALIALVVGLLLGALLIAYRGNRIAQWVENRFAHIGSLVQLPGVGGGAQLATISALDHIFDIVPKELAVSCGIMLWLVSFVAIVPAGLLFAHHERLSLRKLSKETEQAEEAAAAEGSS